MDGTLTLQLPVAEEVLQRLQEQLSARLLQPWLPEDVLHPLSKEVVGIGIGPKFVGGKATNEPALVFYVREKKPRWQLEDLIPERIEDVLTDVEECGEIVAFQQPPAYHREKLRPVQPGCSIGTATGATTGTFGAVVVDGSGQPYLLGNNHVLADCGRFPVGGAIIQPGSLDTGHSEDDVVAHLVRSLPLERTKGNEIDCALARPVSDEIGMEILYIGRPQGIGTATIGMPVHKTGRSTGYTTGFVRSTSTDYLVKYGDMVLKLTRQVAFKGSDGQPFSGAGDSGALVLDSRNNLAVALLNAGTEQYSGPSHVTLGSGIARVLSAFGVQLA
jgi:hypothetical protein